MTYAFRHRKTLKIWGMVVLCANLLAACGGTNTTATPEVRDGTLVSSGTQLTLYKFDRDVLDSGKSVCNNTAASTCATTWPPLRANTGDTATGEYTIITRDDGSLQWAASGKPLYYYFSDTKVGDQLGENVGTVWHVATTATTGASVVNAVLIGSGKSAKPSFTLYKFDRDVADSGASACISSGCIATWPPLQATATDKANGVYTIITRPDGSLQWAANGKPLYFYTPDVKIGDQLGDNVGTVWHVAKKM
jgi:predicted lipoprotein with Yx(FWY)xxD motif